ncbi:MAG: hypothetical protein AB8G11_16520 [Saprospiraceae bacterium]
MLVEIKSDVFENEEFRDGLNHLLGIAFYKGRYNIFIELASILEMPYYQTISEGNRMVLEAMFNKVINEGLQPQLVISSEDNETYFTIDEAVRVLERPVIIILENSLNDSHFVKAIMRCFNGEVVLEHKRNGWVEFTNAGGVNNIINLLRGILQNFRALPKNNHTYLRAFILMDSDRKYSSMPLGNGKQNTIRFLDDNNIPYHILEKREMENYLPDEVIDTIPNYRDFIDAYLRLSPIQKDYFDLENGLPNRKFVDLFQELQDLYNDLDETDKRTFRNDNLVGFPNGNSNFKSEFLRLFNHRFVTKETLQRRCEHHYTNNENNHPYNPDELPNLVQKIADLL